MVVAVAAERRAVRSSRPRWWERADAGEPRRANRAECRANCREKRIDASGRSECWPRMYEFYGDSWVGIMRMFVGGGRGDFVIHCFLDDWRLRR